MTYVIHYVNLSKPAVTYVESDDASSFLESLPGDESAYPVHAEEDLDAVPTAVLVAIYNAGTPDGTQIKKFENRNVARTRTWPHVERLARKAAVKKAVDENPEKSPTPEPAPVKRPGQSPVKGKRLGIGKRMAELLEEGFLTHEVLAKIREEFPESRAKAADVSIIRRKMREAAEDRANEEAE